MKSGIQLVTICSAVVLLVSGAESTRAIQLGHTYSPSRIVVGGKLTYTYSLENNGEADESGTVFTNQLPANAVFVLAVATNGAVSVSNNVVSFRPERLWAGEATVIQVVVTPISANDATNSACWVSSAGTAVCAFSVAPVDSVRPGPEMVFGREEHTSTLLNDHRVLLVGGWSREAGFSRTKTAEVYMPDSDSFSLVGSMTAARANHTTTMLTNGMVLVVGGTAEEWDPVITNSVSANAEVFDPACNTFSVAAILEVPRTRHTATLLGNGDLILAGGAGANTLIERLHSEGEKWTASHAGYLLEPRTRHVASLLPDGKILFAGGTTVGNAFAEIFDPESGTSQMVINSGTQLPAVAAGRGRLLLHGLLPSYLAAAEIYSMESNTFAEVASAPGSYAATHYLPLNNGDILQTGGAWTAGVNIFDLRAGTFKPAPALATSRCFHSASQLADGRILLTGGYLNNNMSGDMRATEIYAFRLDFDFDGMDDEWELTNGFDPARREDAVEDADGEGHTNLQEYLAGTNPRDPLNVLKIETSLILESNMQIRFPTVVGKYYRVEKSISSNLDQWAVVVDLLPGNGRPMEIKDPLEPGTAPRLYRVLLLP